jgi:YHS domain-containing protein
MAKDLVCDMEVNEKTAKWKSNYKGKTYYFCAPGCKKSFDEEPEMYIAGKKTEHDGCNCGCGGR